MATVYKYHKISGVYLSEILADEINGEILLPPSCTTVAPPSYEPHVTVPVWNKETDSWDLKEDHRRYLDESGTYVGGTCYWLPEDDYTSEGHYMSEPGSLPENASLTKPEKPVDVIQKEQLEETISESKIYLNNTDYRVLKFFDKYIQSHPEILAEFEEEYPDTLSKRQEARETINSAQANAQTLNILLTN